MRKKIVAGNWKMNMELNDGISLARAINDHFQDHPLKVRKSFCVRHLFISALSASC